jgi:DNA recombination protein RmuC
MEIILLFSGLAVGAVIGWLFARSKFSSQQQQTLSAISVEQEKNKTLQIQLGEFKHQLESAREKILKLNTELASTEADYRNLQEKLQDQKKEVDAMQEKFSIQFKNLANDILEEKSKKFTEQNRSSLFDLLKPLVKKYRILKRK